MKQLSFLFCILFTITSFGQKKSDSKNHLELIQIFNKDAFKKFASHEDNILNNRLKDVNAIATILSKPFPIKIEEIQPFLSFSDVKILPLLFLHLHTK